MKKQWFSHVEQQKWTNCVHRDKTQTMLKGHAGPAEKESVARDWMTGKNSSTRRIGSAKQQHSCGPFLPSIHNSTLKNMVTPIHPIPKPESNNSWMNPVTHAQCIFYTLFKFYVTSYLYGCSPIKSSLQCFTALPLLRQKFGECRWTTLVSFKEYLQACVLSASADAPTPQHAWRNQGP